MENGKKIYCIYCGTENNDEDTKCRHCHKKLHPKQSNLKLFLIRHTKDKLKEKISDSLFDLIRNFLLSHLYGMLVSVLVVFSSASVITAAVASSPGYIEKVTTQPEVLTEAAVPAEPAAAEPEEEIPPTEVIESEPEEEEPVVEESSLVEESSAAEMSSVVEESSPVEESSLAEETEEESVEKETAGFFRHETTDGAGRVKHSIWFCTLDEDGHITDSYCIDTFDYYTPETGGVFDVKKTQFSACRLENGHYYCNLAYRTTDPLEVKYTVFSGDERVSLVTGVIAEADSGAMTSVLSMHGYNPNGVGDLIQTWGVGLTLDDISSDYQAALDRNMPGEGLVFAREEVFDDTVYFTAKNSPGELLYDSVEWEALPDLLEAGFASESDKWTADLEGLVTDAIAEDLSYPGHSESCTYRIPQINLDGDAVAQINAEIMTLHGGYLNEARQQSASGGSYVEVKYGSISYTYYVSNDVLTLVIDTYKYPEATGRDECVIYSVDMNDHTRLSGQEIYSRKGFDEASYIAAVQASIQYYFTNVYMVGVPNRSEYEGQLAQASATSSTVENVLTGQPFYNKKGDVCVRIELVSLAGAGHYEHMLNIEHPDQPRWYED